MPMVRRGGLSRNPRAGVTIVELMIVTVLLSFVIYALYELMLTTARLSAHTEAWANLVEWGQQGINNIGNEASTLRKLYGNDAIGNGYLNQTQLPVAFPRLGNGRLPTPQVNGNLRRDTAGAEQTGNTLLFCRDRNPFDATLVTLQVRRVDVVTLVAYYLSPVNRPMGPWPRSLVLARWESVEFADYAQVMALPVVERGQVVAQLFTVRGVTHLWRMDQAATAAFYAIDSFGAVAGAPDPGYRPVGASNTNVIPNLGFGFAGVAWNFDGVNWVPERVPAFAIADGLGDGFPHGFEIQVIGSTGSRTVMLRLVITQFVGIDTEIDAFAVSAIVNAHEF